MNLFGDLADAIRRGLKSDGYDVTSVEDDDEATVRLYSRLTRRNVEPHPRRILKADDFDPSGHGCGIARLESAIQNGEPLAPYMSKTIADIDAQDSLLDNWGIYHFHLGTDLEDNGKFVRRTRDILLCRIDDTCVYFIKVLPHGHDASAPWYKKELIEIIHKNWPESIRHALADGVTGLSPRLNDQQVAELRRKSNLVLLLVVADGTVYMPPGVGKTLGLVATDGSNVNDTRFADEVYRLTKQVEQRIVEDYPRIYASARQLGYHLQQPVSFLLSQTQPGVYWDILEPNSHFQFRVWRKDI